jgi:hypothetical protein
MKMKATKLKSLSIKIPIGIVSSMDDKARLNPSWLAGFIILNKDKEIDERPVKGLCYNYTFKVDEVLHKEVKLIAIEHGLAVNEFVARLLEKYYR